MLLILGLLLLAIGVWQAFTTGSYSPVISPVSLVLGLILVFLHDLRAGLFLGGLFVAAYVAGNVIGGDKRKVRNCMKAYKNWKETYPKLSEDEICRRVTRDRLYVTRRINGYGIKTLEDAEFVVEHTFDDPLDIGRACNWLIGMESEGYGPRPPLLGPTLLDWRKGLRAELRSLATRFVRWSGKPREMF